MIALNTPQSLSPKAQILWVLKGIYFVVFAVAVFYIIASALLGAVHIYSWMAFIAAFGALLVNFALAGIAYRRFTYVFRGSGIEINSGIFFRRRVLIPYPSIQRTEIFQDIVERILGVYDILIEVSAPIASRADISDIVSAVSLRQGTITRLRGVSSEDVDSVLEALAEYGSRCKT